MDVHHHGRDIFYYICREDMARMMINEQMPTASSDNVTLKAGKVCGPVTTMMLHFLFAENKKWNFVKSKENYSYINIKG